MAPNPFSQRNSQSDPLVVFLAPCISLSSVPHWSSAALVYNRWIIEGADCAKCQVLVHGNWRLGRPTLFHDIRLSYHYFHYDDLIPRG